MFAYIPAGCREIILFVYMTERKNVIHYVCVQTARKIIAYVYVKDVQGYYVVFVYKYVPERDGKDTVFIGQHVCIILNEFSDHVNTQNTATFLTHTFSKQ